MTNHLEISPIYNQWPEKEHRAALTEDINPKREAGTAPKALHSKRLGRWPSFVTQIPSAPPALVRPFE